MKIQLLNSSVQKLTFEEGQQDNDISFLHGPAFSNEMKNRFGIVFKLSIKVESYRLLKVEYLSEFQVDKKLTKKDEQSDFLLINAPAIAYPYLRVFVSQFLLLSGYEPLKLPTINFVELNKKSQGYKSKNKIKQTAKKTYTKVSK